MTERVHVGFRDQSGDTTYDYVWNLPCVGHVVILDTDPRGEILVVNKIIHRIGRGSEEGGHRIVLDCTRIKGIDT